MKFNVIIPSCKKIQELEMFVNVLKGYDTPDTPVRYIPTGLPSSASVNRNYGLLQVDQDCEFVIMIDDDMGGFFTGWQEKLVGPYFNEPKVKAVAARLLTPTGDLSPMLGCDADLSVPYKQAQNVVITAAVVYKRADILGDNPVFFDESYIGSGYEDTDYCFQLSKRYPDAVFLVNNECKLIHFHEMKNQHGKYEQHNKSFFEHKWAERLQGMDRG